jgi:vacuolar-type H+-ATPase subunit E/Vma4
MTGIERVIEQIKIQTNEECEDIANKAVTKCDDIRSDFAKKEQDEYWKFLSQATNEAEQRLIQLGDLANKEAQKKLNSTRREMADIAFDQAAKKLSALPKDEFKRLLIRLKLKPTFTPESVVSRYKEFLLPSVEAILFD